MGYVDELFNRVVFDEEDRAYHKELYIKVKELCKDIEQKCPYGTAIQNESLHLAFQAFSLGLMHVGSCLSRADKYKEKS